ncbi:MAG: type IV pilin protein [Gemmatimonadaceae bacterium]
MRVHKKRSGFTLIELLIVVVIIGILATIVLPGFKNSKGRAITGAIKSDIRNLASAQESFFYFNDTYTTSLPALTFTPTAGVVMTITEATVSGWSVSATHPQSAAASCAVFFGTAAAVAPATVEGVITCL